VALAREVHARELLVEAHSHVRVGLVVSQPDVEARPVALDELLLGEQRLGLRLRHQEVDRGDLPGELEPASVGPGEVRGDALADRGRFAHVEDLSLGVLEHVDAGLVREPLSLLVDVQRPASRQRGGVSRSLGHPGKG
jgi:hypothetical protein